MKQTIRKILKEDRREKYVDFVIDQLIKSDYKKETLYNSHAIRDSFALPPDALDIINKRAMKQLLSMEGRVFDINDYCSEVISCGQYNFRFKIGSIDIEGLSVNIWILDGDVELLDGEEMEIKDAMYDYQNGWEVKNEIGDIIRDIIFRLTPELFITDWDIDMDIS